jgi:transcriptional regulator with XRE-family HTH domain
VWLTAWLADHPEVTHGALARDIGVSKGLISQWATGSVKTLAPPNLAGLARVTGTDLSHLENLVYGDRAPSRSPVLSPEITELIERAVAAGVAAAIRRLREEGSL